LFEPSYPTGNRQVLIFGKNTHVIVRKGGAQREKSAHKTRGTAKAKRKEKIKKNKLRKGNKRIVGKSGWGACVLGKEKRGGRKKKQGRTHTKHNRLGQWETKPANY